MNITRHPNIGAHAVACCGDIAHLLRKCHFACNADLVSPNISLIGRVMNYL